MQGLLWHTAMGAVALAVHSRRPHLNFVLHARAQVGHCSATNKRHGKLCCAARTITDSRRVRAGREGVDWAHLCICAGAGVHYCSPFVCTGRQSLKSEQLVQKSGKQIEAQDASHAMC